MSAALRDYALLWRAALAKRHARANAVLCGLALLCACFVGLLVWLKTADPFAVGVNGMRAVFVVMGFAALMYYAPAAVRLNTPANAMLVPRMRRRLRQLTVLVWVAAAAGSALLTVGTSLPAHITFLCVGLWVVALGMAISGHALGTWIQGLLPLLFIFGTSMPREWLALLGSAPVFAVAGLLALALGAYTLDTMFPQGGERHFRLQAARRLAADQVTVAGLAKQARTGRLGLWVYRVALARDCARRNGGALLMHVLGPAVHWTERVLPLVLFSGLAAGALVVLLDLVSADTLAAIAGGSWVVALSALFVQLFNYERRSMRLAFTRGEQSLARLAPGMPGCAAVFNRRLAWRLLQASVLEWAVLSILMLGLVALTGAAAPILALLACASALTLPLLAANLRDHARSSGSGGWRLFVWMLAALGLSFLAGLVVHRPLGLSLLEGAALAAVPLTALAVAWRWNRLAGAPHAFPVGRLA